MSFRIALLPAEYNNLTPLSFAEAASPLQSYNVCELKNISSQRMLRIRRLNKSYSFFLMLKYARTSYRNQKSTNLAYEANFQSG